MNRKWRGFLFALLAGFAGCGDSDDNAPASGGGAALSNDACSAIGVKIFDGTECSARGSAVVAIEISYTNGDVALCSGTLIGANSVLSAGHCFRNGPGVASATVRSGNTSVPVQQIIVHPGYRIDEGLTAIFNDVAIAKLAAPVPVQTLPLLVSTAPAVGDVIDIFGYGLTESHDSGALRSGQMRLDGVTENHLFATFGADGSNTCAGDSGGPAIQSVNGSPGVIGVTSSGNAAAACAEGDVSLFTNVQSPQVLQFIRSVVSDVRTL